MSSVATMEYVRSFCQGAEEILAEVLGQSPKRGAPAFQMGAAIQLQEINIIIGLTGKVKGQVNYGMDRATARAIAGIMMMEPVEELDEMAISALSELSNMISGKATVLLSLAGATSDITPPSVITGNGVMAAWHGIRAMTIPLQMEFGSLLLTVGIRTEDAPSNFRR